MKIWFKNCDRVISVMIIPNARGNGTLPMVSIEDSGAPASTGDQFGRLFVTHMLTQNAVTDWSSCPTVLINPAQLVQWERAFPNAHFNDDGDRETAAQTIQFLCELETCIAELFGVESINELQVFVDEQQLVEVPV